MIVKNENHVIERCLRSVLPLLNAWVIVDTGSTDGTQATVRSLLAAIPGELYERPWIDFAANRTESLHYAAGRADFRLIIDADELLEFDTDFVLPALTADAYDLEVLSGPLRYYKTQLVRDSLPWRYQGVLHEHITTDREYALQRLPGVRTLRIPDGARSKDPLTYRKDAVLLEGALLQEPANARHMFYLAQSYSDCGEVDAAIDRYTRRVAMGGWAEEVWFSLYRIAQLRESKGGDWPPVMESYLAAYAYRPDRAEPLYCIGLHYQVLQQFAVAHLFFSRAMQSAFPAGDVLFVDRSIYTYLLPLEYSVACFYVGQYTEALRVSDGLLADDSLLPEQREQVLRNRQFSIDAMHPGTIAN